MKNYTILMNIETEELSIIKNTKLEKNIEKYQDDYYFIDDSNLQDLLLLNTRENYDIANKLLKEVGEEIKYSFLDLQIMTTSINWWPTINTMIENKLNQQNKLNEKD